MLERYTSATRLNAEGWLVDDSAFTVNVTVIELLTMQSAIVLKTKLKHGMQQLGILSLLDFSSKVDVLLMNINRTQANERRLLSILRRCHIEYNRATLRSANFVHDTL